MLKSLSRLCLGIFPICKHLIVVEPSYQNAVTSIEICLTLKKKQEHPNSPFNSLCEVPTSKLPPVPYPITKFLIRGHYTLPFSYTPPLGSNVSLLAIYGLPSLEALPLTFTSIPTRIDFISLAPPGRPPNPVIENQYLSSNFKNPSFRRSMRSSSSSPMPRRLQTV